MNKYANGWKKRRRRLRNDQTNRTLPIQPSSAALPSLNYSTTILNIYGINYKFADPWILGDSSLFPFEYVTQLDFPFEWCDYVIFIILDAKIFGKVVSVLTCYFDGFFFLLYNFVVFAISYSTVEFYIVTFTLTW